jgi:hypothetical protein
MNTTYEPHAPDWWLKQQAREDEEAARLDSLRAVEKFERNRKIVLVLKSIGKVFAIIVAAIAAFIALLVAFFVVVKPTTRRRY